MLAVLVSACQSNPPLLKLIRPTPVKVISIPTIAKGRYLIPKKKKLIRITNMGDVFARKDTIAGFSVN